MAQYKYGNYLNQSDHAEYDKLYSPRRLMVWTPPLPNGIVMCQSGDETTTSTKRRSPV